MTVNTLEKLTLKFQAKIFLHGMGWYGNIRTPSYAEQMGIHLMALDDEYKAFAHAHPIPLYRPRPPRMQPVDVPGYGGEIIGIQSNKDGKWYLPKLYLAALDEWGGPLIPSPPKTDAEKLLHAIFNDDMDNDVFFEDPPFGKSKMGEIKGLLDTVDGIANPTENTTRKAIPHRYIRRARNYRTQPRARPCCNSPTVRCSSSKACSRNTPIITYPLHPTPTN
jgi:hypothetical protein